MSTYLALGHLGSPYITVLNAADGSTITIPLVATWAGQDVAWNGDDTYLACTFAATGGLVIYDTTDWSTAATPSLASYGSGVAFSPDDAWLGVGMGGSPYFRVLDTSDWSTVGGTPTLAGEGRGVAFSPNGAWCAIAHAGSPYLTVLDTSDWSTVAGTPTLANLGRDVAFSHDSAFLAVAHHSSPYVTIIDTSTWAVATGPSVDGNAKGVAYNSDSTRLAVGHNNAGNHFRAFTVYNTATWAALSGLPADAGLSDEGYKPGYRNDDSQLAVPWEASPYARIYTVSDWSTANTPSIPGEGRVAKFSNLTAIVYEALTAASTLGISPAGALAGLDHDLGATAGFPMSLAATADWAEIDYRVGAAPALALALSASLALIVEAPRVGATTVYRLILTDPASGLADLTLPMASFQSRVRSGSPSYVSAVIPGLDYIDAINARSNGEFYIEGFLRWSDGETDAAQEIARANFDRLDWARGGTNASLTLVGYKQTTFLSPNIVTLSQVMTRTLSGGVNRWRAPVNFSLRPLDTALWADQQIVVSNITYTVSARTAVMDIADG